MDSNPRPPGALANLFANPSNPTAASAAGSGNHGEDILSELDNVAFSLNQSPPSTTTNPPTQVQAPVFPGLHSMAHNQNQQHTQQHTQQQHTPQQQRPQQPSNFAALQQQILMMRTLNASKNNNMNHVNHLNNTVQQPPHNPLAHNQNHSQVNAAAHARAMAANANAARMSPVQKRARAPISQQQSNHHAQMFLAQQQHLARAGNHGGLHAQHAQQQHQQQQQQQQMALRWSQHQQRMHAMSNPTNMAQLQARQQRQQQAHAYQQQQQQQSRLNGTDLSRLPRPANPIINNNAINPLNSNPINAINTINRTPIAPPPPPPPVEKYGSELARKVCELEIEAARKRQRLEGAASKHHLHALAPDVNAQFADCFDAWQRLLPFHTMLPPDADTDTNNGNGDAKEKREKLVEEVGKTYKKWSEKLALGIMNATAPHSNAKAANGNGNNVDKGNTNIDTDIDNTEALRVAAMGYYDELKEFNKVQAELKEVQRKEAERRHEEMLIRAAEAAKQQQALQAAQQQQAQVQQMNQQQQHNFLQQHHEQQNYVGKAALPAMEGMVAATHNMIPPISTHASPNTQHTSPQQPLGMAEINAMPLPGIHDQQTLPMSQTLPQTEWPFEGGGHTTRP